MAMQVWNKRRGAWYPREAVYVGRPSPWGNPYRPAGANTLAERDRVCDLHEAYARRRFERDPEWLRPLVGKHLVCWCAPLRCHAEVLIELAAELEARG